MNETRSDPICQEASFYEKGEEGLVHCLLCPHNCRVHEQAAGLCRVRKNVGGMLVSENYGHISGKALDPLEKKPLYHFYPGKTIFSVGTYGCNLHCQFCQNWHISQGKPPTQTCSPEQLVQEALDYRESHQCVGIAYTYSEPVVWYEYVADTARAASRAGLKNVMVTNGYIRLQPMLDLLPDIQAMNIDLKGFTDSFYREMCGGTLEPVKETIRAVHLHCHLELTVLLIPGKNDSTESLHEMIDWIASVDPEIPVHFSRYYPQYKLTLPPTSLEVLERAYQIAVEKLKYVYLGNVPGHQAVNTFCPSCGTELIHRDGPNTVSSRLEGDICFSCGRKIRVVGEK